MARPIFIIELPETTTDNLITQISKGVVDQFKEYYTLVYRADVEKPDFKVLYDKDFKETDYKALKKYVKSRLK